MRSRQGFVLIVSLLSAAASAVVALGASPPSPEPPHPETLIPHRDIFRRSISDVSGDIFLLTQPYCYLLSDAEFKRRDFLKSHISTKHDGVVDQVLPPHAQSMHGYAWDYDLRIPLAFYDPTHKWFHPGEYADVAVQQDVAPTLADVLGIAAPDRAEGRILKEARAAATKARPRVIAVIVQDMMGWEYYAAHPRQAMFLRSLIKQGASFTNAQVAHVDVETAAGHAAIGTGAYARGHGITGNVAWHPGLWVAKPVFAATLTQSLSSDAFPLLYQASTLADVWQQERQGQPVVLSMVAAPRAALSLGGHGSMFKNNKRSAVIYLEEHGPQAGSYVTNENFYLLPQSVKGKNVRPYAESFQKANGGAWYGNQLIKPDGTLDMSLVHASPALVRFESDLLDGAIDELKIGAHGDNTDLVFLNFKASDYCGHLFGYESEECGDVLATIDQSVQRLVRKLEQASGGELVVVLTADHGAAPIPELSGGLRYSRDKLLADLRQRFSTPASHVDVVPFMSSSQVWVNQRELMRNGFRLDDVVTFLKNYEVTMAPPWNELASEWLARGRPARQKLFLDVVSRAELDRDKTTGH